jgi:hypothetical protein
VLGRAALFFGLASKSRLAVQSFSLTVGKLKFVIYRRVKKILSLIASLSGLNSTENPFVDFV